MPHRAQEEELELLCANADPNYGTMWFYCKRQPFEPARRVLDLARQLLESEMRKKEVAGIYFAAIILRQSAAARSVQHDTSVTDVMSTSLTPSDFSTGLVTVNRSLNSARIKALPDRERRKLLYGSDHIHV